MYVCMYIAYIYMIVYAYLKNMDIQHENGVIYILLSHLSSLSLSLPSLPHLSRYTHACSFFLLRQFAQNLDAQWGYTIPTYK